MNAAAMVRIRDVSDLVTKGTTPTSLGRRFTSSGVKFLKVETFAADGSFIAGREAFIDDSTHQLLRRSQLVQGDILFSIAGALGRSTVVEQAWLPANTNQAFAIIRPSMRRRSIHPRYLLWQLRSPAIARRIAEINVQAAQANLSLEQVRDFEIPFVSSPEQETIAAALDDVDDLIVTLERLIAKKQAIKQGMMQQLLTGRTRLPGFTSSWSELSLGDVTRIKTGSRNNQDKQAGGRYPFFVRSATVERINSYSYDCEAILVPGEGGIGSIFHYINGKFEVHQRVYKISSFAPNASGRFIYYFMRQYFGAHAMENSVKATVDSLRLPTFKKFQLRLPARDEQDAIVCLLDDAEAEVATLEARLAKARAVKGGMMQQLLTGRTRLPVGATA
ncbi:restriction endonuclease subunit S [Rhodococcus sp. NPDC058521]|uniref:restriction endonuclease subunit S n=1 Tax=Rhodococcus sp. NPDC058521 TaxID=3346536 RepID=UPI003649B54D